MGDVEVHSNFTITEKKTKKVKKTSKRREETADHNESVTVNEIERNGTQGYVVAGEEKSGAVEGKPPPPCAPD